jgi:hypothetical protein
LSNKSIWRALAGLAITGATVTAPAPAASTSEASAISTHSAMTRPLTLMKSEELPVPKRKVKEMRAAQRTAPYVVWMDNRTSMNLQVKRYWVQLGMPGVQEASGMLNAKHGLDRIGGPADCRLITAYIVDVYYQGRLEATTGTVFPDIADGAPCDDVWVIG